jgi:hypothetical protein
VYNAASRTRDLIWLEDRKGKITIWNAGESWDATRRCEGRHQLVQNLGLVAWTGANQFETAVLACLD